MKKIVSILAIKLCFILTVQGQFSLKVGASWSEYFSKTTSESLMNEVPDLYKLETIDWVNANPYLQIGIGTFNFHLGFNYMQRFVKFGSVLAVNQGGGDIFNHEVILRGELTTQEFQFGFQKEFRKSSTFFPYIKVLGTYSMYSGYEQLEAFSSTDAFGQDVDYAFSGSLSGEEAISVRPELGFRFPMGDKSSFNLFVARQYNVGEPIASGLFASEIDDGFNLEQFDAWKMYASYLTFGFALQTTLYKTDKEKKERKEEEKKSKKEEQLLAKQRKEKEKEEERLADQQAKEEKQKSDAQAKAEAEKRKQEEKELKERDQLEKDRLAKEKEQKESDEEQSLKIDASGKPKELKGRTVKEQESFDVTVTELELFFWDNGKEVDGDSVSIFFNGEWVAENILLTKEKASITLQLDPKKKNYLIVYALNEGEHPPNTAAIRFFNGTRDKTYKIYSSLGENGAVSFKYRKPSDE